MPATLTYPGVYVEELESPVRTIIGASTSIAAFVGRTRQGPTDEPVVINSWADFERNFGGLWENSPLSVAVGDFFQNGGGQAVIVRVFAPTVASATAKAQTAADAVAKAAEDAVGAAADAQAVATAASAQAQSYTAKTPERIAGDTVAKAADDFAKAAGNAGKKAETAAAARAAVAGAATDAGKTVGNDTSARLVVGPLTLKASSPGAWANDLRARIDVPDGGGLFTLTVRDHDAGIVEQFANLSLDTTKARRADKILEQESSLVKVTAMAPGPAAATPAPGAGKQWWDDPASYAAVAAGDDQGSDGDPPSETVVKGSPAAKTGLYALDKAEEFNLLCIPPYDFTGGDIESGLIDAAITYCTERRAMLLIDPPSGWISKALARAGMDSPAIGSPSSNAAIYFPRILRPSPFAGDAGRSVSYAPCGAVAGVIARTDTNRGIWKAPAGLDATLSDVPELDVPLTDDENGELNPKGLNCLRSFPAAGRVVWGARTRVGADANPNQWKYLPVRRTALYIEESLYRGTKWVVFEPNDEPLWASIRLNVGSFMNQLFRQGAFQGATPREAYLVKCDKDTTTQADIDRGVVNILVGFAPLKPAEFVILKIQQLAGQIQV
jgi:phage tail sheath protein FI